MDCFDPKAAAGLAWDPAAEAGLFSEPTVGLLPAEPVGWAEGEVGILASFTGEISAGQDLFRASTSTTGVLAAGDSITGYVNAQRDHDWFKLSLVAGQQYVFNLNAIYGSTLDPLLVLRNSAGTAITSNDDSNGTRNSEIRYTASASGTFFLDAGAYRDRSTGQYQLSATQVQSPTGYSAITGFGEASVERAIEKMLNTTWANLPDQLSGGGLYGLDRIGAPEAWAAGYTGQGLVVAVVDTGVDRNHVDLDANIWTNSGEIDGDGIDNDGNGFIDDRYGWNFSGGNANTLDDNNHGTHVAGTIAAENNGIGVTGVAYDAKIMAVKVLGANGSGTLANVARGIRYAADNGAHVINLSLGGGGSLDLQSAVQYAWSKGVAVMMASGNDGASSPSFPAAYATQYGMAVGAIDSSGNLASFANRAGTTPLKYVTAAGVGVTSTIAGGGYATWNGTSMATPQMAGAMALLMQAKRVNNITLSLGQLEDLFTSTASNNVALAAARSGSTTTVGSSALTRTTADHTADHTVESDPKAAPDFAATPAAAQVAGAAPRDSLSLPVSAPAVVSFAGNTAADADTATASLEPAGWEVATAAVVSGRATAASSSLALAMTVAHAGVIAGDEAPLLDPLTGVWSRPWQHRG